MTVSLKTTASNRNFASLDSLFEDQMKNFKKGFKPSKIGIVAMEIFFPSAFVEQTQMEIFDGVSTGKYTIGLGQEKIAVVGDDEDVNSLCLSAVERLFLGYAVSPALIGRVEVGSESGVDRAKSIKSTLMQLFAPFGNFDLPGVDNLNACFGGTAALLNSIAWIESDDWDGRWALVVAGDIALYADLPGRPTSGAAAVAMLIGTGADLHFERGRSFQNTFFHMDNVFDFCKPIALGEYPVLNGKVSIDCYLRALTACFVKYLAIRFQNKLDCVPGADFYLFHCPFVKMFKKAFFCVKFIENLWKDFCATAQNGDLQQIFEAFGEFCQLAKSSCFTGLSDVPIEKQKSPLMRLVDVIQSALSGISDDLKNEFEADYVELCSGATFGASQIGNSYCASLYTCLLSLICDWGESLSVGSIDVSQLIHKRIGLFSYGSGMASALFTMKISGVETIDRIFSICQLKQRLQIRRAIAPNQFIQSIRNREEISKGTLAWHPPLTADHRQLDAFYLVGLESGYRRKYEKFSSKSSNGSQRCGSV